MAVNLPSWKKLTVNWTHIAERHVMGGAFAGAKTVFGQLDIEGVKQVVRDAYQSAKKIATQGDRILLRGTSSGWTVEMWVNTKTKVLETAYPI